LSAIYFDADTFLRKPVSAGDFSGSDSAFGTAGVRDSEIPFIGCDHTLIPFRSKFGLCLNANAINAGVLRMDLRVWREEALGPRILEATERFNLRGNSALNAVVNGSVSLLPIWLNATVHMMRPTSRVFGWEDHDEVMRARNDPALVHFTGAVKPWHSNSRLPFTEEWRAVAREVEWTVSKHSFTYRRRIARAIANRFDSAFRG
jgi:lipopolysaccharide biosynthesis glycosyltransferase